MTELLTFFSGGILFSVVVYLTSKITEARLNNSIKHEYDKKLEMFKNDVENRKKAQIISDLLSEWISLPDSDKTMNKLAIDLFLWLPDDLAEDLSRLLSHSKDYPVDTREFIYKIRKYLNNDTKFEQHKIILFTNENIIKNSEKVLTKI